MKRCDRVLLLTAMAFALPSFKAQAQNNEAGDLKKEVQALRSEVAELKSTLGEINKQLKDVLTTVQDVKKGQAAAAPAARAPDTTVYPVNYGDSPFKGPKDAPVTIAVFSEFQCPFCSKEGPKIDELLKAYPNDVKVVFKHYPLAFHAKAKPAAAATILAQKQKGNEAFWQMHDMIFADQKKIEVPDLRGFAEKLGLDLTAFDAVMADPAKIDELVKADMDEATKCKVTGTPTVMINGLKLAKRDPADYKARIDEILAAKKKG